MAKKAPFFSHDMNARHDPKISAMRGVYGSEGFGWFWMLVEMMAESDGYQLDCKSKYSFNAYRMQLHCTVEDLHKFVNDCIEEFDLFETDGEYFWSNSLRKRMQYRDAVSEKRTAAANKRWEKGDSDANASKYDANAMQKHANETKQNETKQNETTTDGFELVRTAYREMHGVMDLPMDDCPTLTGLLNDGIAPELIIEVIKDKIKPKVRTIRYYVDAIKERHENKGIVPFKRMSKLDREMDILKRFREDGA